MESAITQPDLAKSVQRYQLAVDEAKARLNLAVAPMAWLMPANKKIGAEADGRRPLKSKPTKQPPFKPGSQSRNGCSEPEAAEESTF